MGMIDPILITGAARSGTSMTAGIIHICGGFGGDTAGPNIHNQKGMFENLEIRNSITKPYLKSIGCDPLGQRPLPNSRQVFEVTQQQGEQWRKRIQSVIQYQGYKDGIWYYKGAKMCLFWYMWHLAFPTAKWVIVRREADQIAESCLRTSFMRAYKTKEGWLDWVKVHEDRFRQMSKAGLEIMEVWPSKIIAGDQSEMKQMIKWLGLEWKQNLVNAFVDPALYGGKK